MALEKTDKLLSLKRMQGADKRSDSSFGIPAEYAYPVPAADEKDAFGKAMEEKHDKNTPPA